MIVEKLKVEHLRDIELREIDRDDLGDNHIRFAQDYVDCEYTLALVDDGHVVAVMGGKRNGENCHTWLIGSVHMERYPVATMKAILKLHREAEIDGVKLFYSYNQENQDFVWSYMKKIGYRPGRKFSFDDGKIRVRFEKGV